ncbi:MAG: DMT family transporter [Hyphomicrobiaceae bacterium]|nr:DMT family transporter [Hyphomicrobiaceae bacterium]
MSGISKDMPLRGILYMVVGTMVLTAQGAISKWLLGSLHAGEIMAWRSLMALPCVLLLLRMEGGSLATLKSAAPLQSALRAALALLTALLVILSFSALPLADALSIIFVSPLLLTALSAIVLGESVDWQRWLATVIGFVGAIVIVGPSFQTVGYWALAPLGAALASAVRDLVTRKLGSIDPGISILFWTMVLATVAGFASLPVLGAREPTPFLWLLLAVAAVLLTFSNRLIIAAFKYASGAVMAPLKYLTLIWAAGLGYAIWGDLPDARKIVGAVIVAAAGLYVWRREIVAARRLAAKRQVATAA